MKASIIIMDRHFTDAEEDPEFGKLQTVGTLEKESNGFLIKYKESVESADDCDTSLKIENRRITMVRNGPYNTRMIFEDGKRHTCQYDTPQGSLYIGIFTNAMFADFDEEGGTLNFAYSIDCNGDLISENELKIFVEVKE